MAAADDEDESVEFLPASRALQRKSGGPSAKFGSMKLAAAQSKIDARAEQFMQHIEKDMHQLEEAYAKVRENPQANEEALAHIAMTAREIKGIAGTFGFGLLTQIGDSLYEFATDLHGLNSKRIELIGAHINAMKLVVTHRITGDGGEEAKTLLREMGIATDKLS
jgi:hypothetical protein